MSPICVGVVDADVERRRAAADREVRVAKLRRHRPRDLAVLLQVSGDLDRHAAQLVVQALRVAEIALERVLDADRDPLRRRARARADRSRAHGREARRRRCPAAAGAARRRRAPASPPTVSTPPARRRSCAFGPTPGSRRTSSAREERRLLPRHDDGETAGLARVAADLGDDLARSDAERARQARPGADRRLHRLGDHARLEEVAGDLAEIEIALVEPRLLDRRDDPAHRRPDVARVLPVERVTRAHEDRVRTAADRLGSAHRRVDAEASCDVVRRRDDAASLRIAADDQRLLAQLGILELLDGRVERVEVEMGDDAGHGHTNKRTHRRRRTALAWAMPEAG